MVLNGTITRGSKVRFLREGTIIWKGTITSLRRFKDDAREVQAGFECGIGLSDYQDLRSGDIIETFEERRDPEVLTWRTTVSADRRHAKGSGGAAPYARALRVNQVLRQVVAEELERLADADERLRSSR